eukprot:CAMPEP_0119111530 /NCGR_PEP_ID=MMETSP1180-20130426/36013_1 /TAXON_ID=3052 ORGANISM="Chlamydomonas cf sp, Strain CCMP681" /NCGR_SAMPLE_ID=MMETSP1180 /ASSEMBLY_ACC=CAM_ASM_000741 /LENGTH=830 /DNA_ID=CAMNT_0007098531 /DNA_START=73 /DNA_END=2565 /DNA_ORIENTATION=+
MSDRPLKRSREDEEGPADGEAVSMNIEESNKLRISLGMKPLSMDAPKANEEESRRHLEAKRQQEQKERAQAFVASQSEKKRQVAQDGFLAVKGLGDAGKDDDMQNWVERQRVSDVARKAEEAAARRTAAATAAKKRAAAAAAAGADSDDEGAHGGYTAADLAGLKVKHSADDLGEGESMVLTLADQNLLDKRGQAMHEDADKDELENVLKAEIMKRKKARDASAPKAKPLWEEDGKQRGLLDKYNEEEEAVAMQLGAGGSLESMRARVQEDVRKKLAAGGMMLETAAVGIMAGDKPAPAENGLAGSATADYYTEAEVSGFKKRDKTKKKRKMRAKSPEAAEGTDALIEQLEAAAEAAALEGGAPVSELGSRGNRLSARERTEAELRAFEADRRGKFEAAVEKGNWASHALRPANAAAAAAARLALGSVGDEDEDDRDLQESLARARRLALHSESKAGGDAGSKPFSMFDGIAASAAKAREEEEVRIKEELANPSRARGGDTEISDIKDFVQNIEVKPEMIAVHAQSAVGVASVAGTNSRMPPSAKPSVKDEEDDYMDLEGDKEGTTAVATAAGASLLATGWVSSVAMDTDEAGGSSSVRPRQFRRQEVDDGPEAEDEGPQEKSIIGEQALGKGLAGALAALKNSGSLTSSAHITWAGRVNDRSKNALQGLGDVYSGGMHEERLARSIEAALTTKDEFGRIMTPKERFRQLCYDFHGKRPSKNKETTRLQKAAEEISRRKNATSEVAEHSEVAGLKRVTERVAQPYVVLQGKGAMESLKAMGAGSLKGDGKMPPPPSRKQGKGSASLIPGNLTPLLGDRKVEAMLGIKKAH